MMSRWIRRKSNDNKDISSTNNKRGVVRERIGDRDYMSSPYVLPKDAAEVQRLDFQHYLLRYVLQGLYLAPLSEKVEQILDVGCGTGRWCLEMAEVFPDARIVGIDLIKPQPVLNQPRCTFLQGDVTEKLPFADATFDYCHQRLLIGGLPFKSWPGVVRDVVRVTKPGGWVELLELSVQLKNMGPATTQYMQWVIEVCRLRGIDPLQIRFLGAFLSQAGLKNVHTQEIDVPIGRWGGRLGSFSLTNLSSLPAAIQPLVEKLLHVPPALFQSTVQTMLQEVEQFQTCWTFYSAYGQHL